jgi:hypothetical protein
MGGACGDPAPDSVTFGGTTYSARAAWRIPDADLTNIGRASELRVNDNSLISDRTVLAIKDIDPAVLVAMYWDRTKWKASEDEPVAPNWNVVFFLAEGEEQLPAALCRYFDPREESSPIDCQSRVSVTVDGREYVSIDSLGGGNVGKAGAATYLFLPTDLHAYAEIQDLDPRLGEDVSPTVYAIKGVDPGTALALVRGDGLQVHYLVFVREGATEAPFGLCPFIMQDPDAVRPEGCLERDDDPALAILETLSRQQDLFGTLGIGTVEYTIEFSCFCPPELRGPFKVRASHDEGVIEVRAGDQVLAEDSPVRAWLGRVDDLFDYVRLYAPSDTIDVRYDPTYAFPVEMRADPDATAVDDEFGFKVVDFTVLGT